MATGLLMLVSSALVGLAVGLAVVGSADAVDWLNAKYLANLGERMDRLGLDSRPLRGRLRFRWLMTIGVFLVVGIWLHMIPVGIVAALLTYYLMGQWLEGRLVKWRQQLRDQLVGATRALAAQVRAGLPLTEALASISGDTPDPLGGLLRRAVNQSEQGRALKSILLEMKERLRIESFSLLVVALLIAEERGGKLADVLERIGHSLQEQQRVERKRESDTAAGRLLVNILATFPAVFLGMFYLLDPEGTSLVFATLAGQLVLCVVAAISVGSLLWGRQILARIA
ncbi:MAG TPA: type II secretion system F family protein [Gemmataceae bacterium]|nr:type II secretion system F family protein [Gemmataceae bacterium]